MHARTRGKPGTSRSGKLGNFNLENFSFFLGHVELFWLYRGTVRLYSQPKELNVPTQNFEVPKSGDFQLHEVARSGQSVLASASKLPTMVPAPRGSMLRARKRRGTARAIICRGGYRQWRTSQHGGVYAFGHALGQHVRLQHILMCLLNAAWDQSSGWPPWVGLGRRQGWLQPRAGPASFCRIAPGIGIPVFCKRDGSKR